MLHAPTFDGFPTPVDERTTRRRRRIILALTLGLTVVSLGAGMSSLAVFTDTDDVDGSFATGTIDIEASPSVAFTVGAMVPGDSDTQALTIDNDGSAALRYSMTAVASDPLGDALTVEVRALGTGCATFDGAVVLAATALDGAAVGDPSQGDDPGDRDLAAMTSEVLCVRIALPLTAGDALQGATSAATLTFDAEQTANNP